LHIKYAIGVNKGISVKQPHLIFKRREWGTIKYAFRHFVPRGINEDQSIIYTCPTNVSKYVANYARGGEHFHLRKMQVYQPVAWHINTNLYFSITQEKERKREKIIRNSSRDIFDRRKNKIRGIFQKYAA